MTEGFIPSFSLSLKAFSFSQNNPRYAGLEQVTVWVGTYLQGKFDPIYTRRISADTERQRIYCGERTEAARIIGLSLRTLRNWRSLGVGASWRALREIRQPPWAYPVCFLAACQDDFARPGQISISQLTPHAIHTIAVKQRCQLSRAGVKLVFYGIKLRR